MSQTLGPSMSSDGVPPSYVGMHAMWPKFQRRHVPMKVETQVHKSIIPIPVEWYMSHYKLSVGQLT